jgi:hypothetical protein
MKCLIVHRTDKGWYGEEVSYKKSGSGFYRETNNIVIPQNRDEIVKFAAEGDYSIEWRDINTAPGVVNPASAATG